MAGFGATLAASGEADGNTALTTGGTGGAAGLAMTETVAIVSAFAVPSVVMSTGETFAASTTFVFCSATNSSAAREICSSRSSTENSSPIALRSISMSKSSPKSISSACSSACSTSWSSFCALDLEAIVLPTSYSLLRRPDHYRAVTKLIPPFFIVSARAC
ncbi:hypothetical protein FQZ97_885300 [compost metagenome]